MKPTPGPYMVRGTDGTEVRGVQGVSIAWFPTSMIFGRDGSYHITGKEARANAEAFVAGMDAMEGIERLRKARENYGKSNLIPTDAEHKELMDAISAMLGPKE